MPIILTMWHGQHFLMPFVRRPAAPMNWWMGRRET